MSLADINNHKRFLAIMSAGLPMPKDLADWYQNAVKRHIDEGLPLCVCLGIRGAGIRTEKTRELMRRRDTLLNAMQGSVYAPWGSGLWGRCVVVSDLIKRYPRSANEHSLLRHIFALDITIPSSPQGIYDRVMRLRKPYLYSQSKKPR